MTPDRIAHLRACLTRESFSYLDARFPVTQEEAAELLGAVARVEILETELRKWSTLECPCCGEEGARAQCFEDGQETTCGCGGSVSADGEEAHINVPDEEECPKCNDQSGAAP